MLSISRFPHPLLPARLRTPVLLTLLSLLALWGHFAAILTLVGGLRLGYWVQARRQWRHVVVWG